MVGSAQHNERVFQGTKIIGLTPIPEEKLAKEKEHVLRFIG